MLIIRRRKQLSASTGFAVLGAPPGCILIQAMQRRNRAHWEYSVIVEKSCCVSPQWVCSMQHIFAQSHQKRSGLQDSLSNGQHHRCRVGRVAIDISHAGIATAHSHACLVSDWYNVVAAILTSPITVIEMGRCVQAGSHDLWPFCKALSSGISQLCGSLGVVCKQDMLTMALQQSISTMDLGFARKCRASHPACSSRSASEVDQQESSCPCARRTAPRPAAPSGR